MPSTICSNLLPHYTTWKSSLDEMHRAMMRYQKTGDDADRRDFDTAYVCAEKAMHQYRSAAYLEFFKECVVGGKMHRLFVDDAEIIVEMMGLFRRFNIGSDFVGSFQGRIIFLQEYKIKEILEQDPGLSDFFLNCSVNLKGLQMLYVPTHITEMPDKLSETIEEIKIDSSHISALPEYHLPRLKKLELQRTSISSLPQSIVGDALRELWLPSTIQTLPDISSSSLEHLLCGNCKNITQMSKLPPTLQILILDDSGITSLTDLPDGMWEIDIANTPAAQDEATREYLEEYAERNNLTQIVYEH